MPLRLGIVFALAGGLLIAATVGLQRLPELPRVYEGLIGTGIQAAIAIFVVLAGVRFLDNRTLREIGCAFSSQWGYDTITGLVVGTGLVAGVFFAGLGFGWFTVRGGVGTTTSIGLVPGLLGYALLMVLIGFHEEVFMRGYLLTNLYEGFQFLGNRVALVVATALSSSMFAGLHTLNPNASIVSTLGIFTLSLLFSAGYIFTDSLGFPVGAHIAWNFTMGVGFGLPVSGMETTAFLVDGAETGPDIFTGGTFGPEAGVLGVVALLAGVVLCYLWASTIRPGNNDPIHLHNRTGEEA